MTVYPGRYRHYKGNEYTVLGVARHSETDEKLIVYRQEYGDQSLWVRPLAMFLESVKVEGKTVARFELVTAASPAIDGSVHVQLRKVESEDLPHLYEFQLDRLSNQMAAVNPRSEADFYSHWQRILEDSSIFVRSIVADDELAGCISCFKSDGADSVGYWVGKRFWGKGIATRALQILVSEVETRPLHARVASTNLGSLRVLQKCGFKVVGRQHSPANERFRECDEELLELGTQVGDVRKSS